MFTRALPAATRPTRPYVCYRCLIQKHRQRSQWLALRQFASSVRTCREQHLSFNAIAPDVWQQPPSEHADQVTLQRVDTQEARPARPDVDTLDAHKERGRAVADALASLGKNSGDGQLANKSSFSADLSLKDAKDPDPLALSEEKYTARRNLAAAIAYGYESSFHAVLDSIQGLTWAELSSFVHCTQGAMNEQGVLSPIFTIKDERKIPRAKLEQAGINMERSWRRRSTWLDIAEIAAVVAGRFKLSHDSVQALGLPILLQLVKPAIRFVMNAESVFAYEIITGTSGLTGPAQAYVRQMKRIRHQDRTIACPESWIAPSTRDPEPSETESAIFKANSIVRRDALPSKDNESPSEELGSGANAYLKKSFWTFLEDDEDVFSASTGQIKAHFDNGEEEQGLVNTKDVSDLTLAHPVERNKSPPTEVPSKDTAMSASKDPTPPTQIPESESPMKRLLGRFENHRKHWEQLRAEHESLTHNSLESQPIPSPSVSPVDGLSKAGTRLADLSNFADFSNHRVSHMPEASRERSSSHTNSSPSGPSPTGPSPTGSSPTGPSQDGPSKPGSSQIKTPQSHQPSKRAAGKGMKGSTPRSLKNRGRGATRSTDEIMELSADDLHLESLVAQRQEIPTLAHDLQRVLFNPGIYQLQDPRTKVYNFSPYLQNIVPVSDFNFRALKDYIISSKDETLRTMAAEYGATYYGSSSSMTSVLAQFHLLLSQWRPIEARILSQSFGETSRTFSKFVKAPTAVFAKYQNGTYAIDADKEFETTNVLMEVGKSLEKFLTLPPEQFERYRRGDKIGISEQERREPEAYHYTKMGDFLMRSQLDAKDPRLPGSGVFDLKTRAVVAVRMNTREYDEASGYQINHRFGDWQSYEREYYDMLRAAMLKYSLQVRMGRMDGIFVAYHNVQRIFGFQYISLPEMDLALHGQKSPTLGDLEFKYSLRIWNEVLNRATKSFPEQSLRMHFETRGGGVPFMYIFVEPVADEEMEEIQNRNKEEIEAYQRELLKVTELSETSASEVAEDTETLTDAAQDESFKDGRSPEQVSQDKPVLGYTLVVRNLVNGMVVERPTDLADADEWKLEYTLSELTDSQTRQLYQACRARRKKINDESREDNGDWTRDSYMRKLWKMTREGRAQRQREMAEEQTSRVKLLYPERQRAPEHASLPDGD